MELYYSSSIQLNLQISSSNELVWVDVGNTFNQMYQESKRFENVI